VPSRSNNVDMKSVATIAELLRCFTIQTPSMSLAELARSMNRSKATVHRYANALERVGFLGYDAERQRYSVGPEILRLAAILLETNSVIDVASPVLKRLTREAGQTTTLSMWISGAPVVVLCEMSGALMRLEIPIGTPLPPHSAAGLVFRAFLEEGVEIDPTLEADVETTRASGVAVSTNTVTGVRAVAAPVLAGGRVTAAITVLGTTPTMPADLAHPLIDLLRGAASELSYKLGGATAGGEEDGVAPVTALFSAGG
jgi:IclR family transcriptional regulator, acetate operon repressor